MPAQGADFINDSRLDRIFASRWAHDNNLLIADTEEPFITEFSLATGQFVRNLIDLRGVGLDSAQDIKYSPESGTYLIPSENGILQFNTDGELVGTYTHPASAGASSITPALNALLPPRDFISRRMASLQMPKHRPWQGSFCSPGAEERSAVTYEFEGIAIVQSIPLGATWKYSDIGSEPGAGWQMPDSTTAPGLPEPRRLVMATTSSKLRSALARHRPTSTGRRTFGGKFVHENPRFQS